MLDLKALTFFSKRVAVYGNSFDFINSLITQLTAVLVISSRYSVFMLLVAYEFLSLGFFVSFLISSFEIGIVL